MMAHVPKISFKDRPNKLKEYVLDFVLAWVTMPESSGKSLPVFSFGHIVRTCSVCPGQCLVKAMVLKGHHWTLVFEETCH